MTIPERITDFAWFAWLISWFAAAAWADRATKRPPIASEIAYRIFVIAGVVLLFGFADPAGRLGAVLWHAGPWAWVFVVMAIAGLAFTWWARLALGRLWSSSVTRKSGHRIVASGPYALVRHPIYTGVIAATIATAAIRPTGSAWLGAMVMTIGWYIKAKVEENFLRKELGAEAYDAYARRVPMLIPFAIRRQTVEGTH